MRAMPPMMMGVYPRVCGGNGNYGIRPLQD